MHRPATGIPEVSHTASEPGDLHILMARSDSLLIYGLILSTLLNTLRFTSDVKVPTLAALQSPQRPRPKALRNNARPAGRMFLAEK